MKHLLLTLFILLSFTACNNQEEDQAKAKARQEAKEARAIQLAKFEEQKAKLKKALEAQRILEKEKEKLAQKALKAQEELKAKIAKEKEERDKKKKIQEENNKLNPMGIKITEHSFSIDTNKSKAFINALKAKVDSKIKILSEELEKGIIQSKDAGIDINKKHINVDLNKTEIILKDWKEKIEVFVHEFDNINIEKNNTNKGK